MEIASSCQDKENDPINDMKSFEIVLIILKSNNLDHDKILLVLSEVGIYVVVLFTGFLGLCISVRCFFFVIKLR